VIAGLIDTGALLKLLYTSLIAGVGVAVIFSFAILGATRSGDMRRQGRSGAASAFAVLGMVSVVLALAIVVLGLVLVVHKS
jgi:hypothetical protein